VGVSQMPGDEKRLTCHDWGLHISLVHATWTLSPENNEN